MFHVSCQKISKQEYTSLKKQHGKSQIHWFCDRCNRNSANFAKLLGLINDRQDKLEERISHAETCITELEDEHKNHIHMDKDSIIKDIKDLRETLEKKEGIQSHY